MLPQRDHVVIPRRRTIPAPLGDRLQAVGIRSQRKREENSRERDHGKDPYTLGGRGSVRAAFRAHSGLGRSLALPSKPSPVPPR